MNAEKRRFRFGAGCGEGKGKGDDFWATRLYRVAQKSRKSYGSAMST
jgi:hypothetical protein